MCSDNPGMTSSAMQPGAVASVDHQIPRISVIIPTHNRADLLIEALESVFSQTWSNYEVIVVNDGSTDNTAERIRPYLDRVHYLHQSNRGVAAARNLGIRHSRGNLICFLDSDDLWVPTKLQEQIAFAEQNPQYALIATEIDTFNSKGHVERSRKARMYRIHNGMIAEHLLFDNWIQTSTVMVRREVLLRVGGFDEDVGQFGEDWLLWMRIATESPVYFMPRPLVNYRMHERKLTSWMPESQYKSLMRIFDRLALLPLFQTKPELVRRARYRVSIGRGRADLRNGSYKFAVEKLRAACQSQHWPAKGWVLLTLARLLLYFSEKTGKKALA